MTKREEYLAPLREPPQSIEAEKALLGSMLIKPEAIEECQARIPTLDAFVTEPHRIIFSLLLGAKGLGLDMVTFTQLVKDQGDLDAIGGPAYIAHLFTFVPSAANVGYYIDIVREKWILRRIIAAAERAASLAFQAQDQVQELLDETQAAFTEIALDGIDQPESQPIRKGVDETVRKMEVAFANRGEAVISGLATGFFDLDRMLGGIKPHNLAIIAARPSNGKTAMAMNIAEHVAVDQNIPVAIFSLEMSYQELADRATFAFANLNLSLLRTGFFEKGQIAEISEKLDPLRKAAIYIDDTPALKIFDFKAKARALVMRQKVGLIVVDYLQLMQSTSRRARENKQIEIAEISAALKATAKELGIAVIACAQLNRDVEKRTWGRPKLSDLRESGSIENDADIVMLIWRPIKNIGTKSTQDREKLSKFLKLKDDELDLYSELILAKQRNGPVGEISLLFEGHTTRFKNVTAKQWSNNPLMRQGGKGEEL
jgi:replicative DNA helicase